MEITKKTIKDIVVIAIDGPVDGKTGSQVQAAVEQELKPGAKLLLDLTKVDYMSSAGLRVLLLVHRQATAQKLPLALTHLSPELLSIMTITGFLPYFTICPTVEDGVNQLA